LMIIDHLKAPRQPIPDFLRSVIGCLAEGCQSASQGKKIIPANRSFDRVCLNFLRQRKEGVDLTALMKDRTVNIFVKGDQARPCGCRNGRMRLVIRPIKTHDWIFSCVQSVQKAVIQVSRWEMSFNLKPVSQKSKQVHQPVGLLQWTAPVQTDQRVGTFPKLDKIRGELY